MAKFEVSGAGAEAWLNQVMANRMPPVGRMVLSPMLSPRGRLAGDFSISRVAPERFFVLGADTMQLAFMRHLGQFLPAEDVNFKNLSADYGGLHICGPNAREFISRLPDRIWITPTFRLCLPPKCP